MLSFTRKMPSGRWFVLLAFCAGTFFMVRQARAGVDLYVAFIEACGAAAALMVLFGLAERLYSGDRFESVQLPGGAGASFENKSAVDELRADVGEVAAALDRQSAATADAVAGHAARLDRIERFLFADE